MMSTEHPYDIGSPQYEWLQADLQKANANRENVPWLILTGMHTKSDWLARTDSFIQMG